MTKIKRTYLALVAVLMSPMAAQADIVTVEVTFDDDPFSTDFSGEFSYDNTTGQAWSLNTTLTAFVLSTMSIVWSGTAEWDETEWNGAPPTFGVIVDSMGRAALFGGASDTVTGLGWGNGIVHSEGLITSSDIDVTGFSIAGYVGVSVPEPSTLALLGIGLFVMGLSRRRKKI